MCASTPPRSVMASQTALMAKMKVLFAVSYLVITSYFLKIREACVEIEKKLDMLKMTILFLLLLYILFVFVLFCT